MYQDVQRYKFDTRDVQRLCNSQIHVQLRTSVLQFSNQNFSFIQTTSICFSKVAMMNHELLLNTEMNSRSFFSYNFCFNWSKKK